MKRLGLVQRLVLLGGLSLLTALVVAAQFRGAAVATGTKMAATAAAPGAPSTSPPAAAAHLAEAVRWQGQELILELDEVPLPLAITLLARATRTTVAGVQWLQQPPPVTLHGRTGDVSAAWQLLLHKHAVFSMACSATNCQLWITGQVTAAPATAAPPGTERALPAAADPAAEELERSQPGGSC